MQFRPIKLFNNDCEHDNAGIIVNMGCSIEQTLTYVV